MRLKGRVALVTGGASGIGRATALLFAQEGAKVVVADVLDEGGNGTVSVIREGGMGEAVFVHADVSRVHDVEEMVQTAVRRFGKLDVLFNNAGIEGPSHNTADYPEDAFDKVIAINLKGVWLGMKYAIPVMLANGDGSIINTTSVAGLVGFRGVSGYCASKGGIIQITKTAALEYAKQKIRVNAIAPGVIRTPMVERFTKGTQELENAMAQMEPVGRLGDPKEVAAAALFLASDESSFITGQVLVVDGGFVAQ